jgi:peroxiredoxin
MDSGDFVAFASARYFAPALLIPWLLISACTDSPERVSAAQSKPTRSNIKAAPEFALKDSDGRTVKLSEYKGKVVLLNFWATWCGPCKVEIPWFIQFEQQYKDRGFAVLGVAMDEEGWSVVRPYITDRKMNYRILLGDDAVAQSYGGVDSLPTSFIINREGKIAARHVGLVAKSDYEDEIKDILDNKSVAGVRDMRTDRRSAQ